MEVTISNSLKSSFRDATPFLYLQVDDCYSKHIPNFGRYQKIGNEP